MDELRKQTQWVTTQDCMGIPGFPGTAANVRKKLDLLATGNPTMKRKREGSKAYEYHVSLLPDISRRYFYEESIDGTVEVKTESLKHDYSYWWDAISHALSDVEMETIIESFKNRGKSGIFLKELLATDCVNISNLSRSAINTALILEKLSEEERKEILAQYGLDEQDRPVAPKKVPHTKAG